MAFAAVVFLAAAGLPALAASHKFTVTVVDKNVNVGAGMSYAAWTYNGTVPGPLLSVRQGDEVHVELINHTSDAHGIDVNAAQISPDHFSGDPMKNVSYSFKAEVPGVFMYHCTAIPILDHIAGGMFGMAIVEPKDGWPNGPAQSIDIVQSEIYGLPDKHGLITGDHAKMVAARPDFVVFNGRVNRYDLNHPIPIKVGKLVRLFFLDAGPNLSSTVHISGVIFSTIYPGGDPANVVHGVGSFEVAPSQGVVLEFSVNHPGNYVLSDLSRAHGYKGAMAILHATR